MELGKDMCSILEQCNNFNQFYIPKTTDFSVLQPIISNYVYGLL